MRYFRRQKWLIRVRQHEIANQIIEIMASRNELAQGSDGRAVAVDLIERQTIFRIRAPKIRKLLLQFRNRAHADWIKNAISDFNAAVIKSCLPFIGRGNYDVSADQFAPV